MFGFIVYGTVFLVGAGAGLRLGYRLAEERAKFAQETLEDLLSDITPHPRTNGTPTNIDGPTAAVRQGTYRQRRRWDLQG